DIARLVADIGQGPVPLTRLEFLLLRELAEHIGQSVSKGSLLASVWGYDFDPGSNVVDVCVRRIRSKLGFELIKTVRGEGYQLVAQRAGAARRHPAARDERTPAAARGAPARLALASRGDRHGVDDLRARQPRLHLHVPRLGDHSVPRDLG